MSAQNTPTIRIHGETLTEPNPIERQVSSLLMDCCWRFHQPGAYSPPARSIDYELRRGKVIRSHQLLQGYQAQLPPRGMPMSDTLHPPELASSAVSVCSGVSGIFHIPAAHPERESVSSLPTGHLSGGGAMLYRSAKLQHDAGHMLKLASHGGSGRGLDSPWELVHRTRRSRFLG